MELQTNFDDESYDSLFIDTDCLSTFLYVDGKCLLEQIFDQIIISEHVAREISLAPYLRRDKSKLQEFFNSESVHKVDFSPEEYDFYRKLIQQHKKFANKKKRLGEGEASCITLAKCRNGIMGSNNLSDVLLYVKEFNLKHITTADIFVILYNKNIATKEKLNEIWCFLIQEGYRIGATTFDNYLDQNNNASYKDRIERIMKSLNL